MSQKRAQVVDIFVENDLYQHLDTLKRNRKKRHRHHEIFVEGVSSINALVQTGHVITSIAYNRDRALSAWAESVMAAAQPARIYRLAPALMDKLSDRADPSELIVTAQPPGYTLDSIPVTPDLFAVLFERPSNHGNLGSLLRSCDAFGVDALITTGHGVDIYDPAVIRASLGTVFYSRVVHVDSPAPLEAWMNRVRAAIPGVQVVGTHAQAAQSLFETTLAPPLILVLGSEAPGMSRQLEQMVDVTVSIPMQGHADSLNVACAGSILLYHARQSVRRNKR